MTIKEKMMSGALYCCSDPELMKEQMQFLDKVHDYNQIKPSNAAARTSKLQEIFAEFGEDSYIETPFYANWGNHTHIGRNVYANFRLTLVDDNEIFIGDYTMIGPNVTIVTASHPIDPAARLKIAQYNLPVKIGKNVWIGTNAVIFPGVTIGDNSVIGAGSLVTKDIPSDVVAYGAPCRVIRPIDDHDRQYYRNNLTIDI